MAVKISQNSMKISQSSPQAGSTEANGTEVNTNPFSTRRKFNTPAAQSPVNEMTAELVDAPEPAPAPVSPTVPLTPKVEEATVSDKEDTGVETPMLDPNNPMKKIPSKEELLPILDSLLQHGYALDKFFIRKTPVLIRTRFTWEEQYIYQHLEDRDPKTALNYQREYQLIMMSASLVQYGDYVFDPINKGTTEELSKSMLERYDFMCSLSGVVTDIIQMKLSQFDEKQRYIIDNFDDLLKAF